MGIANELIIPTNSSTIEKHLMCSVCLDLLTNPMETADCQHTFCLECVTKWMDECNKLSFGNHSIICT